MSNPETQNQSLPLRLSQDTLKVPFVDNNYLHIWTTNSRLSRVFGDFSAGFGHERERSQDFFMEKVHFRFGKVNKIRIPGLSAFDQTLGNIISTLQGAVPLGTVIPHNDEYIVCIDPQAASQHISRLATPAFEVKDYAVMSLDEKIASIKQTVDSITEHEFFHLIQYMTNPDEVVQASKHVVYSMRLLFAYAATTLTAAALAPPRHSELPILLTAPLILGATLYLNRGKVKIENGAYEAQKIAHALNLESPYEYSHER